MSEEPKLIPAKEYTGTFLGGYAEYDDGPLELRRAPGTCCPDCTATELPCNQTCSFWKEDTDDSHSPAQQSNGTDGETMVNETKTEAQTTIPFEEMTRPRFVLPELVKQKNHNVGVVTAFIGTSKHEGKNGTYEKANYRVDVAGHGYEWGLNKSTLQRFKVEIEMKAYEDLIGKRIKFDVKKGATGEFVEGSIIPE